MIKAVNYDSKEIAFPWITPGEMQKWIILIRAHLGEKAVKYVIDTVTQRPYPDPERLAELRRAGDPAAVVRYRKQIRKAATDWDAANLKAYGILVKACTLNSHAMTVVLAYPEDTAYDLLQRLIQRFDQSGMLGVKQAKLAAFNSMVLDNETAPEFVDRITRARIDLVGIGCDYIDYDVHCLGRLKEGMLQDPRYKELCLNIRGLPECTWDRALELIYAHEISNPPTQAKASAPATATPADEPLTPAVVRRLIKQHGRDRGKKRAYKGNKKPFKQADGNQRSQNSQKKQWHARGARLCYTCGKPGHEMKDCRQRHQQQRNDSNNGNDAHFDGMFGSDTPAVRMLRPDVASDVSFSASASRRSDEVVVDSGATSHIFNDVTVEQFGDSDIMPTPTAIRTGKKGAHLRATGRGAVGSLRNVLVVPQDQLLENVASVPQLDLAGYTVTFANQSAKLFDKKNRLVAEGKLGDDKSYRWSLRDIASARDRLLLGSAVDPRPNLNLYHRRLGHRNKRCLRRAIIEGRCKGIPISAAKNCRNPLCDSCVKAKATRHSFARARRVRITPRTKPLVPLVARVKTMHTDMKGPMSVCGPSGEKYLQIFTDGDTKWRWIKFLKKKSDASKTIRQLIEFDLMRERQSLVEYWADGAPELISEDITTFLAKHGTKVGYSPPYTPELNGVAERSNRTIYEAFFAMWLASNLPCMRWVWAAIYSETITNCLPTDTAFGWMSPFEARYGIVPDLSYFRVFGCVAYVYIADTLRTSTFATKAYKGYFIGINFPQFDRYKVYVPALDKVVESAHVLFDEYFPLVRQEEEYLIIDPERKSVDDFKYLNGLLYMDTDSSLLYVTTTVRVQMGYIVAPRAPIVDGRRGPEEPSPVHAKDVELMLTEYLKYNVLKKWDVKLNKLIVVCSSIQGAPARVSRQLPDRSREQPVSASQPGLAGPPVWEPPDDSIVSSREQPVVASPPVRQHKPRGPPPSRPQRHAPRHPTNVSNLGNIGPVARALMESRRINDYVYHYRLGHESPVHRRQRLQRLEAAGEEPSDSDTDSEVPELIDCDGNVVCEDESGDDEWPEDDTEVFFPGGDDSGDPPPPGNSIPVIDEDIPFPAQYVRLSSDEPLSTPTPIVSVPSPSTDPLITDSFLERLAYMSAKEVEEVDEGDVNDPRWVPAKLKELFSQICEHTSWIVTPLPADRKAITCKWVLKNKPDRLKARLTPRGFQQKQGVDYSETFAPVAKLITLRIFLAIVAILSLYTLQSDIKTAFLNADLKEEIYCNPPFDMIDLLIELLKTLTDPSLIEIVKRQLHGLMKGSVLLFKKACYGLKQAPREWWLQLLAFLKGLGFVPTKSDPCLFVLHLAGGVFVLLLLYVDDILFASNSESTVLEYSKKVSNKFRVSQEGPISSYLGIDIVIDRVKKTVSLSMENYVLKMMKRFKLLPKQSVKLPLPENFQVIIEGATVVSEKCAKDFEYKPKVGCALYLMICMHPEWAFSIGLLARQTNKVSKVACAGLTNLLQYCYNTRKSKLVLSGINAYITAFCDSDWAGCRETRRSTGGYIIYLGGSPVEWGSKRQALPAQSTAEAEYIAMLEPAKSILWLRWLLKQLGIKSLITEYSSTLFGDNNAAHNIASNPVSGQRTKHIALKYHYIRALVEAGVICLEHIDTLENVSDIFTKALGNSKFDKLSPMALGLTAFERPTKRKRTELSDEFV